MQVETHDGLREPRRFQSSRVVIYDDYGNPLAVLMTIADGTVHIATIKDGQARFQQSLRHLGVDRTAVVTDLSGAVLLRP